MRMMHCAQGYVIVTVVDSLKSCCHTADPGSA